MPPCKAVASLTLVVITKVFRADARSTESRVRSNEGHDDFLKGNAPRVRPVMPLLEDVEEVADRHACPRVFWINSVTHRVAVTAVVNAVNLSPRVKSTAANT